MLYQTTQRHNWIYLLPTHYSLYFASSVGKIPSAKVLSKYLFFSFVRTEISQCSKLFLIDMKNGFSW